MTLRMPAIALLTISIVIVAMVGTPVGFAHAQTSAAPMTSVASLRFPRVEGTNLEGRQFTMPRDFEGELNVVLVAFAREQQADVDSWMPFLQTLMADRSDIRVYELPTLNRNYRLIRRMIDGGMARGITDKATREITITMYIDKNPFKRALSIENERQIVALLVTRDGHILWRADGVYSAAVAAGLTDIKDVPVKLLDRDLLFRYPHRD